MKKTTKSLAFFLLFSSIIIPILPTITVAQADQIVFRRPTSSLSGDWDPAITDWYNAIAEQYLYSSLEYPVGKPIYDNNGVTDPLGSQWIGILVTDWDLELWPSENNSQGFNNTGGYKTTTFTLRENVTFTDGSNWNATVFKWNIDRVHLINGNYTGAAYGEEKWEDEEGNLLGTMLVEDNKPYFTKSWNLSAYDSPYIGTTEPTTPPGVTDYAWYDLGPNASLVEYPGVTILPNNTVRNPTPYGGWNTAAGAAEHWAPYDRFPGVKYVEILEDKASGGKIKVHHNAWITGGLGTFVNYPMLSYHTYKDDYTIHGIYGWENDLLTAPNPTIVDQMVGTGPYIFVEHDETGTPPGGHMIKNENYWNKTALEDDNNFQVDRVEVIKFPAGELGRDAQNTALLTHAIDYSFDSMFQPLDYNAIQANPNIAYYDAAPSEYKTNIVLNCINETWYAWPWADGWRKGEYGELSGNFSAGGVPRAMRKAMSYAFNYDLMIGTVLNDRAVRNGGTLGKANLYYNSSVGIADFNLTKAREILLTTETDPLLFNTSTPTPHAPNALYGAGYPFGDHNNVSLNPDLYNYSKLCAARGLTASSPDGDWEWVADNNPIYTFNFYYDSAHQDVYNVLLSSLKKIGVALVTEADNKVNTIIWDTVRFGTLRTFDGDHGLFSCNGWVMDEHMPHDTPQLNTFWHYVDPDRGRWRDLGAGGITSWHYWGNFGFNFVAEIDLIYDRLATSSQADRKQYYSEIARIQQEEKFGVMFLYEAKEGWALWKDWEIDLYYGRQGIYQSGLWGGVSNSLVRFIGLPPDYPLIPGSPLLITLTVTAVSMLGIAWTLIRKKKLR
jgi:ABC-type transport system substrate-binding protein